MVFNKIKNKLNGDSRKIFICNLLISIMNFSITIILIRLLGQSEFGNFVIISNLVIMLQVFIGLKSGEAILHFVKNDNVKVINYKILKQIIVIDILVNMLLYLFTLSFGYFYLVKINVDFNFLLIFSFSILTAIGLSIFENLYLIKDKLVNFHFLKLISTSIHIVLVVTLGYFFQIYGVLFAFSISYLVRTLIFFINVKEDILISLKVKINLIDKNEIIKFFHFFKYSYLSTTFKSGSQGLDIFLLSTVLTSEKIALYEAAKKLTQIPGLLFGSIWMAKSKKILEYGKANKFIDLKRLINNVYFIFLPLGLFSGIIFFLFSKDFIYILYGEKYIESYKIATIFFTSFWFSYAIGGFARVYFISISKLITLTYLNGIVFFGVLIIGYLYTKFSILDMSILLSTLILINSFFLYLHIYIKSKKNV